MHNAPSVSYPVGRCAFQRWLYVLLVLFTSAMLCAWALSQGLTLAWWGAACAMGMGTLSGWLALGWFGVITWDGQAWWLQDQVGTHEIALGDVEVILDVQKALLLRWQPASDTLRAKPRWLWLSAENANHHWQDFRRAVYQRSDMH